MTKQGEESKIKMAKEKEEAWEKCGAEHIPSHEFCECTEKHEVQNRAGILTCAVILDMTRQKSWSNCWAGIFTWVLIM
jgi:hypothetical protein